METEQAKAEEEFVTASIDDETVATDETAIKKPENKFKTAAKQFFATKNIVRMAVLTALSYVLYLFVKIPMAFFAPWLELQISDLPALMGGFMMGPLAGGVIIVLKCLLKMPFSTTACVGELADIAIGLAYVLPAAFFYKYHRSKKGAALALLIGSLCCTAMAIIMNAFVLVPFYVTLFFGGNEQAIVSALASIFPKITWQTFLAYYLPLSVLPFNLIRCAIVGLLTFLLYKQTQKLFDLMTPKKKPKQPQN